MKFLLTLTLLIGLCLITACDLKTNPNLNKEGKDKLQSNEVFVEDIALSYLDTVYVPIYSDIYSQSRDTRFYLTATLSIRNTSLTDSIYLKVIDYYDTDGNLVRKYLDGILLLKPMQSIDYVIDEDDKAGGSGANFIIEWGAKSNDIIPVFQGVMLSTARQQGISFLTNGVSISRRKPSDQNKTSIFLSKEEATSN